MSERAYPNEKELVNTGRLLRARGCNWAEIARQVGTSKDWIRRRLDPQYLKGVRERDRSRSHNRRKDGSARAWRPMTDEDLRRYWASMPADKRDLTGRMFGDPVTGRSALDMRQA